jgi:hypothetical protein
MRRRGLTVASIKPAARERYIEPHNPAAWRSRKNAIAIELYRWDA